LCNKFASLRDKWCQSGETEWSLRARQMVGVSTTTLRTNQHLTAKNYSCCHFEIVTIDCLEEMANIALKEIRDRPSRILCHMPFKELLDISKILIGLKEKFCYGVCL
jgi:hypothetical protein